MISKIKTLDRMNTCYERLLERTEREIELHIVNAADDGFGGVEYVFKKTGSDKLQDEICQSLRKAGYTLLAGNGARAITIVWKSNPLCLRLYAPSSPSATENPKS